MTKGSLKVFPERCISIDRRERANAREVNIFRSRGEVLLDAGQGFYRGNENHGW